MCFLNIFWAYMTDMDIQIDIKIYYMDAFFFKWSKSHFARRLKILERIILARCSK